MCLGFPGRVEKIDELTVDVDIAGTKRNVSRIFIADELNIGDWVMVHAGFAMSKMDENEAKETLDFLMSVAKEEESREEEYYKNIEDNHNHDNSNHECGCNKESSRNKDMDSNEENSCHKESSSNKDIDSNKENSCGNGCGCSTKK